MLSSIYCLTAIYDDKLCRDRRNIQHYKSAHKYLEKTCIRLMQKLW